MKGSLRALALFAFSVVMLPLSAPGVAQEPLRTYRRIFVPKEDIDRQVRGLLPLKRDEFERRLRLASKASNNGEQPQVVLQQAKYRARLDGNNLIDGRAELQVIAKQTDGGWLSLEPSNLALTSPIWQGKPERPAVVGLRANEGLMCRALESGVLQFDWTRRGELKENGDIVFDLRLPATPLSMLSLDLPQDGILTADAGIVSVKHEDDEPASNTAENISVPEGFKRWDVNLGGAQQVSLRISRESDLPVDETLVLAREIASYTLQPSAVDLEVTFDIDVLGQPLGQLRLLVDQPLALTSMRLGERDLEWSVGFSENGRTEITAALAEPLTGLSRKVSITATAIITGQSAWRLPQVHLSGATRQEGRVIVSAAPSLQAVLRPIGGCRQIGFTTASVAQLTESSEFQCYSGDSEIEVTLPARRTSLKELSGTHLEITPTQVYATYVCELSSAGGQAFTAEAVLARQWVVDSVDVLPADIVEERVIAPRGRGLQALTIALRRPIQTGKPLRVAIKAHRPRPVPGEIMTANYFHVADFQEVAQSRQLVSVHIADPASQLRLSGDASLNRLATADLTAQEQRLFESPLGTLLFVMDHGAEVLEAELAAGAPRYRAEVITVATVHRGQISQECRINCIPEGSTISKMVIRFSPPPTGPLSWQLAGEDQRGLVVNLLEEQAAQDGGSGESVFSLELARPRSAPFEIRVGSSHALGHKTAISLVTLPTAATQKAEVSIHSVEGAPLAIAAEEMQSLPPPHEIDNSASTLLGRFRYEAGRRPRLEISARRSLDGQSVVWADSLTLESRFSVDGSADHEAVFQINNLGAGDFAFRLPLSAGVVRAAVDGEADGGKPKRLSSGEYIVSLPPGRRRATVRLHYFSEPLAAIRLPWRQFSAPLPQTDMPVHSRQWSVMLAPAWKLAAQDATHPSMPTQSPDAARNGFNTWNNYQLQLPQSSETQLTVYSPAIVTSWSWCLAIASAALVMRMLAKAPALTLPLLGLLAAAAILAPPPHSILLTGAALGVAGGAMALLLRPVARRSLVSELGLSHSSTVLLSNREVTAVLWGIAFFLAQLTAQIDQPLAAQDKAGEQARRLVVIPVDDRQQPTGDYVFVSPPFYDSLMRLSDPDADSSAQWVLTNAVYQLPAAASGEGSQPSIEGIGIQFEIETFRSDVVVQLPLRRSQLHLVEGSARLDGGPASVSWADDGLTLQLPVETPGKHRFEMHIGAAAKSSAEGLVLDVEIPRIATSRAILAQTTSSSPIVISALGAQGIDSDRGQRHCDLGPAERLVVQWPGADGPVEPAIVEAEQLVVWRVRPGSVIADAKFRVRPLGGKLRDVQIRIDPRLRLLPLAPDQGIARHRVEEGSTNVIHLELAEPVETEAAFSLSFLWAATSGVGNLVPPDFEVVVDRVSRHWTAVILDERLDWEPAPPRIADAPPAEAFATAWGAALDAAAVAIFEGAAPPLMVRPADAQIKTRQTLDYSVSKRSLSIHYAAELTGLSPHAFLHRLAITPRLRVTKVAVSEGGAPVPIRWSHEGSNILAIALSDAPASEQRIEVEAEMEFASDQARLALPLIRLSELEGASLAIRVFRQSDVQIQLQASPKWNKQADPPGQFSEGLGRLVAAIGTDAANGLPPPVILLSPNEPRVTGNLVTRVFADDAGWQAEIVCDLAVTGGLLDGLRLAIPDQWTGPLEITPAVEHRSLRLPGQALRHLHIRPQQAVTKQLTLTIRTPLRSAAGELVAAPNVALLDAPEVERIVVLQTADSGSPIEWQTSGLQAAGGEAPNSPYRESAGFETYRVVAPYFVAIAHRQERPDGSPVVRQADVVAHCFPNHSVSTETAIDLDPGGKKFVLLEIPSGYQLVNVSIEGIPAQLVRMAARIWQVRLVDELLPQRLTIVCSGSLPLSSGSSAAWEIAAPQVAGVTPLRTLWTVSGLEQARCESENTSVSELDARHYQILRVESLAQTIGKFNADSRTNGHAGGLMDLWRVWLRRYEAVEAEAVKSLAKSKHKPLLDRISAANRQVAAVEQALIESGVMPQTVDIVPPPPAADPVAESTGDHHFTSTGATERITVISPAATRDGDSERWNWAAAAIGLSLLSFGAVKSPAITAWMAEQAHLLVGLAGCGWLLFGTPAWPGWLVLALAAWLALRTSWSPRRSDSDSALVRRS